MVEKEDGGRSPHPLHHTAAPIRVMRSPSSACGEADLHRVFSKSEIRHRRDEEEEDKTERKEKEETQRTR